MVPYSKLSLKMSCLTSCGGDVEKATALYEYFIKGVTLPDIDPIQPSPFQQVVGTAGDIISWIKENKSDISDAISIIQSFRKPMQEENVINEIPPLPIEQDESI